MTAAGVVVGGMVWYRLVSRGGGWEGVTEVPRGVVFVVVLKLGTTASPLYSRVVGSLSSAR